MKIALVIPTIGSKGEKSLYDYRFYSKFMLSKKYISYPLAIPTLAAMTPPEHQVRVFDENTEEIDYDWNADLVGITARTMFAKRAYAISEAYNKRGVRTVLGGIHPSMCTEEALQHCDSVVVGEAEHVWHALLQDVQQGKLKRVYKSDQSVDLTSSTIPDRSVLAKKKYLSDVIQTTKGCPFNCEFCSVHAFDGQEIRNRTVEQVIEEVKAIKRQAPRYKEKNSIFFADDNILANKKFARELFRALEPYNVNWMCQASIDISNDDDLLRLMRDSGCGAVLIGFESVSEKNLAQMHKAVNRRFDYAEAIRKIQLHGILVHGSFVVGYDFDSQSTLDELIDFIKECSLLVSLINVLTPFPGTKLFQRLEQEGRILHTDWSKYDTRHVVFSPAGMTAEELLAGYRRIMREVYSFDSILRKLRYYWDMDFWNRFNEEDPVKFKYRLLLAIRLCTLLASRNIGRSKFILRILPHVFGKRARVSSILTLMAYNDFAYSL
jgi:radical SAM superfamily enzyme YgiQ (UPF0313 family)